MINKAFILIFLIIENFKTINSILVLPFKINTYTPKKEGQVNITDLINEYLIHDMFTTIEIGSGSSTQKVTTLISQEESILSLSSNICKKKSLQTINDLSIVSQKGLDIKPYNSEINTTKNYINYIDDENKIGLINDSILLYNTTFLSCQPIEYDNQKEKDTKININNVSMPIKDKNKNEDEKLCGILGIGSPLNIHSKLKNISNFINFLKKNNIINDYSWTFKFHTKTEGRLIIGDKPHFYESNNRYYNEDKFKKTETYSPDDKDHPWSLHFKEISFVNDKNETIYVGKWIKMILIPNIGFIIGEDKYKDLIYENYFKELIEKNICILEKTNLTKYTRDQIYFGTSGFYEMFHCDKSLINEKKIFPKLNFIEPNLEYIFSFSFNNLFQLIDERYYFLVIFPEDITHAAYKVWYLGLPFYYSNQFVFSYESKTIGIYDQNINIDDKDTPKDDDKDKKDDEGNNKDGGKKDKNKGFSTALEIIIITIVAIILLGAAFYLGKKYNDKRKKRANELKDDDYDYAVNEENNIKEVEDNLIQNNN